MKNILILTLSLLCAFPVIAKEKIQLAIYSYGNLSDDDKIEIEEKIGQAIQKNAAENYSIVERDERILTLWGKETKFQDSGLVAEDEQLTKLGQMLGADWIIGVKAEFGKRGYKFSAKILNTVSGENELQVAIYPDFDYADDVEILSERELDSRKLQMIGKALASRLGLFNATPEFLASNRATAEQLRRDKESGQKKSVFLSEYNGGNESHALSVAKMSKSELEDWKLSDNSFYSKYKDKKDSYDAKVNAQNKKTATNFKALGASFVPGLGLILKGRKTEGLAYLLGDAALIGGGVGMIAYANNQQRIMDDKTTDYDAYIAAEKSYKAAQTTSAVFGGAAGLVYVVNLVRAFVAEPTYGARLQWAIVPTSVVTPSSYYSPGASFVLAYSF